MFSEASIPGPGFPYTDIIDTLHADPAIDGRTAAESIADLYHAWYDGSDFGESTTISAYALESGARTAARVVMSVPLNMCDLNQTDPPTLGHGGGAGSYAQTAIDRPQMCLDCRLRYLQLSGNGPVGETGGHLSQDLELTWTE